MGPFSNCKYRKSSLAGGACCWGLSIGSGNGLGFRSVKRLRDGGQGLGFRVWGVLYVYLRRQVGGEVRVSGFEELGVTDLGLSFARVRL